MTTQQAITLYNTIEALMDKFRHENNPPSELSVAALELFREVEKLPRSEQRDAVMAKTIDLRAKIFISLK